MSDYPFILVINNPDGSPADITREYPNQDAAIIGAIYYLNKRFSSLLNTTIDPARLGADFSIALGNITQYTSPQTVFRLQTFIVKPKPQTVYHIKGEIGDPLEFGKNSLPAAQNRLCAWLWREFTSYRNGAHGSKPTEAEKETARGEYNDLRTAIFALEDTPSMYLEFRFLSQYYKIYRLDRD